MTTINNAAFNNSSFIISRLDLLKIYMGIITQIGLGSNLVTQQQDSSLLEISQQPNRYETAYLTNGAEGIIELVCQDLMRLGFIEIRNNEIAVATYFRHTSHLEPLEQIIFDYLHVPRTEIDFKENKDLQETMQSYCRKYHQSLIDKGYLRSDSEKYLTVGIVGLIILVSAMFKPVSGIVASYRYLILPALVVMPKASLAIAATAWFFTQGKSDSHKLTTKGKKYLNSDR